MSAILFLEGGASGAHSKELQIRCREGFRKLLEKCGYKGRMPRLVSSGPRGLAFDDFRTGLAARVEEEYIGLWIDGEDSPADPERTWDHLGQRDGWEKPQGAADDQVLFMTTCMETLIVSDRSAMNEHYGAKLQVSALPALESLEDRGRHDVQDRLSHATRYCSNAYQKGKRSFEVLAKLTPATLEQYLPSFARTRRILNDKL